MDRLRNVITLNQESQIIVSQPTSYLRTSSLPKPGPRSFLRTFFLPPTYQKAVCEEDCSNIETPPPEYQNLFFSKIPKPNYYEIDLRRIKKYICQRAGRDILLR